jgi:hypothetical protein
MSAKKLAKRARFAAMRKMWRDAVVFNSPRGEVAIYRKCPTGADLDAAIAHFGVEPATLEWARAGWVLHDRLRVQYPSKERKA